MTGIVRDTAVVLSGGMDSTVAAYLAASRGRLLGCITFDYGQRHAGPEMAAARKTVRTLDPQWYRVVDMTAWGRKLSSALTDSDSEVPHGHYAEDNMAATVVPNRNMTLIAAAAGIAASLGATTLTVGVHAGDHPIYADCRPEFIQGMGRLLRETCGIALAAPFVSKTKRDIAELGVTLRVPWETTWSCYEGLRTHCGRCGTCVERLEALDGLVDRTAYRDADYWRTAVADA